MLSSAVTADGGPAKPDIVRGAPAADAPIHISGAADAPIHISGAADAPLTLIDSLPIGTVESLEGTVTAVRSDGVALVLAPGDPLFPGDLIATHVGAAAGLRLSDGTVLSIGGDSRVILDEAVFDPAGSAGSLVLNLLEGVLVTVSGAIAKLAPDAMVIETPVAAIAVRGIALGLAFEPGNAVLGGALLPQSDPRTGQPVPGEISISVWGPDGRVVAAETIATPGLGFTVVAGDISIAALTPTAASRLFGPAMTPILDGTGIDPRFVQPDEDQGQRQDPDADLATRLAAFVTEAGGDGADVPAAVGPILLTASPLPGLDLVPISVPMPPPLEPMALPGAPGPAGVGVRSNNALFDGFFELVTFEVPILFTYPRPPPFVGELLVGQDEPGVIDIFTLILPPIEGAPRVVLSIDSRSIDLGIPHTLPSGAEATVLGGGNIRYDPAGQFRFLGQGQRGNDLFTYQVPDGDGGIVTGVVNVAVQGINDPPVAVDDILPGLVLADDFNEIPAATLLANDFDPDRDDVITLMDVADLSEAGGTVGLRADGSIAYDPREAFRSLPKNETATDTFTYTIEDRFGGTDTATVTLTVTGVNNPPEAKDDVAAAVARGEAVAVDILANDLDPDDDDDSGTLRVIAVEAASGATVDFAGGPGAGIVYRPATTAAF
ncbi:MAG: hypothetical protein EA405_12100, partial [Rhodospirillales bacterium]